MCGLHATLNRLFPDLPRCSQVYGKTALDLATYKEHLSVVSILRQHEVDTELSFTNKLEQQRGVVPGMGF